MTVTSSHDGATSAATSVTPPAVGPLWLRVAEFAADNAGAGGVLALDNGELVHRLAQVEGRRRTSSEVSRAIRRAVDAGWLDARSSTRVLLVVSGKRRARGGAR